MTNDFLRINAGNWVYNIADALKGDVENLAETICPGVIERASFVSDLFTTTLSRVDWVEIVENWAYGMDDLEISDRTLVRIGTEQQGESE